MKFKNGDKVRVLINKCPNSYDKNYLHHDVGGKIFEITAVNDNCIHLLNCKYAFMSYLLEKVENMKFKDGDKVRVPIRLKEYMFPDVIRKNIGAIYTIRNTSCGMVHLIEVDRYLHQDYLEKVEDMEEFKFGELVEVSNKTGEWTKRYYLCSNIGEISGKNYYVTFSKQPAYIAITGDLEYWNTIRKYKKPKEYSMQEIADVLKIDVKDLRIKK